MVIARTEAALWLWTQLQDKLHWENHKHSYRQRGRLGELWGRPSRQWYRLAASPTTHSQSDTWYGHRAGMCPGCPGLSVLHPWLHELAGSLRKQSRQVKQRGSDKSCSNASLYAFPRTEAEAAMEIEHHWGKFIQSELPELKLRKCDDFDSLNFRCQNRALFFVAFWSKRKSTEAFYLWRACLLSTALAHLKFWRKERKKILLWIIAEVDSFCWWRWRGSV